MQIFKKLAMLLCGIMYCVSIQAQEGSEMELTAAQVAAFMAPGWNLGNTLEATGYGTDAETAWQPTKTTQLVIDYVKAQGFKSVRIPCSWYIHFDSGTSTINSQWMARVKEVVDYCIKDGLYVVLNDHWDSGWLEDTFSDVSASTVATNKNTLTQIWTQVANAFADYDEHLLFAGLNEPGHSNGTFDAAMTAALVEYEQTFINAVRATGGNNARRVLVVQGPSTDITQTCNMMTTMPTDAVSDRLMVEVHYYDPWQLSGMTQDESWGTMAFYWGEGNHSGTNRDANWGEEDYVAQQMDKMKTAFADKGYPVIIGEYGAIWRDVTSNGGNQDLHDASIKLFYKTVTAEALKRGFVPMVWDENANQRNSFTLINRANCSVYGQPALEGIFEAVDEQTAPEAINVTISNSTYATLYYLNKALTVPDGVSAYAVAKNNGDLVMTDVGDVIPAGLPVVLNGQAGIYSFSVVNRYALFNGNNDLTGSEVAGTFGNDGAKYYVLSYKNKEKKIEEVGFYWLSGSRGAYATIKAHQAYLRYDAANANANGYTLCLDEGNATSDIGTMHAGGNLPDADGSMFNLAGQRVGSSYRGVVIRNGKKVVR